MHSSVKKKGPAPPLQPAGTRQQVPMHSPSSPRLLLRPFLSLLCSSTDLSLYARSLNLLQDGSHGFLAAGGQQRNGTAITTAFTIVIFISSQEQVTSGNTNDDSSNSNREQQQAQDSPSSCPPQGQEGQEAEDVEELVPNHEQETQVKLCRPQ